MHTHANEAKKVVETMQGERPDTGDRVWLNLLVVWAGMSAIGSTVHSEDAFVGFHMAPPLLGRGRRRAEDAAQIQQADAHPRLAMNRIRQKIEQDRDYA